MATAYKYYRLWFTKNSSADLRYYTINTWNMYEAADQSGLDAAVSGTMTSSGVYMSQTANLANDASDSTYWESDNRVTVGSNAWLKLTLPSALTIRAMRIKSSSQPNEKPRDFLLQGSNDDSSWTTIVSFVDFMTTAGGTDRSFTPWVQVKGVSKQSDGLASARVLVSNWSTGALLASIVPASDGSWSWPAPDTSTVLVTHIGATGFRPISDGPITPAEV